MALRKKLRRWLKLGLFVGAGTAAAVLSACDSAVKKIDTGPPDVSAADISSADRGRDAGQAEARVEAGKPDLAATDQGVADQGVADKQAGWDIPLE